MSDPRLKAVLDWIANEDAKESTAVAAQSAVSGKNVASAQSSYDDFAAYWESRPPTRASSP